jgi:type I restriction enzyme R subunit
LRAIVGARKRTEQVAADIVTHWESRRDTLAGKALAVCMSRRICAELYDAIVKLRPDWHSDDDHLGKVKVIITGSAADGRELAKHTRSKQGADGAAGAGERPGRPAGAGHRPRHVADGVRLPGDAHYILTSS